MNVTPKQRAIVDIIAARNPDGSLVDFDELLERLPYRASKASTQFLIRALIDKGLIEKGPVETRRGAGRRTFRPTEIGEFKAGPSEEPSDPLKILEENISMPEIDLLLSS